MWTSAMVLSLATVFAIVGIALVGIAVVTDNWTEFQVDRRTIIDGFDRQKELNVRLKDAFTHETIYYSRNYGLFQICFPDTVPSEIGSFNKLGSPCINNPDYFPMEADQETYTSHQILRLYLMRATVILYVLGIAMVVICFMTGIFGCWRRSASLISLTSLLLLLSVMFLASCMICWHIVNYMERSILEMKPFYKSWEKILKSNTRYNHGFSYVASWVGIVFLLLATIFMYIAKRTIKKEHDLMMAAKSGAYIMPYDKPAMMVPYGYNTYAGYNGYPYYNQHANNGYYGYMTYGRMTNGSANSWLQNSYS